MIVIADSSPINVLVRIGCIDVLPKLFSNVLIPPEVRDELADSRTPEVVREFIARLPEWIEIRAASRVEAIPPLDKGEEAAIALAIDVRADALLIDERDGRREAKARGLVIVGTLGVLEAAAQRDLVALTDVFQRLRATDFRVDPRLVQQAVARDAARRRA